MKRSQNIELSTRFAERVTQPHKFTISGLAAVSLSMSLAACAPEAPPADTVAYTYKSVKECVAGGVFTQNTCESFGKQARLDHLKTAPRFEDKKDCEDSYGAGSCETVAYAGNTQTSGGGNSFFMPYMMGYMMGSNNNGGAGYSTPVYRSYGGSYVTANGADLGSNAFSRVAAKTGTPTYSGNFSRPQAAGFQSHSSVVSRGGFGASGAKMSMGG